MALRFTERGFFYLLFVFQMGIATSLLYSNESQDQFLALQGTLHLPITVIQLTLALTAGFLILTRWQRVAAAALKAWPLLLLWGIQVLSMLWSIHPDLTLRKDVLQLIFLCIGIYMGERYTTAEIGRLLLHVLCFAMVAVIVLVLVAPSYVVDHNTSHWALKGLSQNKNGFGFYIGLTAALLLILRFQVRDWLRYFFIPAAFVLLVLSRSMTSAASAAAIIVTMPIWFAARLRPKQRAVAYMSLVGAFIAGSILVVTYSAFFLGLMGRDSTFTGRTEVWKQLLVAIRHHPILGYGYGAFWTGLRGESLDVLVAAGWIVPAAHNAYLELWLAVGIPGIAVAIMAFWSAFRMAIDYIRSMPGWAPLWPMASILFILLHGLGESEFVFDSSFACSLFTALYTSLALRKVHQASTAIQAPIPISRTRPFRAVVSSSSAVPQI